jgi:mono/diheme cytochrome c family protein
MMTLALLVAVVLAIVVIVRPLQAADPYVQKVLALPGQVSRGQEIFQMNCAVCHGIEANGEVGPSLLGVSARKSKANLIKQVVSGKTPPMPQFQPNPQDMADLLRYLESL